MEKVTLKDKTFKKVIPYEAISDAIDKVAAKINKDFKNCSVSACHYSQSRTECHRHSNRIAYCGCRSRDCR